MSTMFLVASTRPMILSVQKVDLHMYATVVALVAVGAAMPMEPNVKAEITTAGTDTAS